MTTFSSHVSRGISPVPNGIGQCEEEPKAVHSGVARNLQASDNLHALIGELESRLQCVIRQEPCANTDAKPVPQPPSTTVYQKLHENADRIGFACNRIQELLRLIEL